MDQNGNNMKESDNWLGKFPTKKPKYIMKKEEEIGSPMFPRIFRDTNGYKVQERHNKPIYMTYEEFAKKYPNLSSPLKPNITENEVIETRHESNGTEVFGPKENYTIHKMFHVINKDDKYYTPKIEEFHIGLEYRFFNPEIQHTPFNATFSVLTLYDVLYSYSEGTLNLDHYQVKYLDREDMESLGFTVSSSPEHAYESFKKKERPKGILHYTVILNYSIHSPWLCIKANNTTLFAGHVLNKSELKRILNQIGYGKVD